MANGWRGLQSIISTARAEREYDLARPAIACKYDGEPIKTNLNGIRFCPYCGWLPETDGNVSTLVI